MTLSVKKGRGKKVIMHGYERLFTDHGWFCEYFYSKPSSLKNSNKVLAKGNFCQSLHSCLWVAEFSCKETKKFLATLVGEVVDTSRELKKKVKRYLSFMSQNN